MYWGCKGRDEKLVDKSGKNRGLSWYWNGWTFTFVGYMCGKIASYWGRYVCVLFVKFLFLFLEINFIFFFFFIYLNFDT